MAAGRRRDRGRAGGRLRAGRRHRLQAGRLARSLRSRITGRTASAAPRRSPSRWALSALGGAACDLGVSREELTLAFADQGRLDAFEKKHGFSQDRVDEAARAGLQPAVDEGEQAGAFNSVEAFVLHAAIGLAPIDKLISYVRQYLS